MDVHVMAAELVRGLGPTLVAAMTGSMDRELPSRWAKPHGPRPSEQFTRRLQFGHRAWQALSEAETEHVARQWFIGGNPLLDEATPLTAIRLDQGPAVMRAYQAFLDGQSDT